MMIHRMLFVGALACVCVSASNVSIGDSDEKREPLEPGDTIRSTESSRIGPAPGAPRYKYSEDEKELKYAFTLIRNNNVKLAKDATEVDEKVLKGGIFVRCPVRTYKMHWVKKENPKFVVGNDAEISEDYNGGLFRIGASVKIVEIETCMGFSTGKIKIEKNGITRSLKKKELRPIEYERVTMIGYCPQPKEPVDWTGYMVRVKEDCPKFMLHGKMFWVERQHGDQVAVKDEEYHWLYKEHLQLLNRKCRLKTIDRKENIVLDPIDETEIVDGTRTDFKREFMYQDLTNDELDDARTNQKYVHKLIQRMMTDNEYLPEYLKNFGEDWLFKGVAVVQGLAGVHEDVYVLYHDTVTNEWYRAAYKFAYLSDSEISRKSVLEGKIQKSKYRGTDDRQAAISFASHGKGLFSGNDYPQIVFFPQGNGDGVVFDEAHRRTFLSRVEGLTAAHFHQLMWPTSQEEDPNDRCYKKYRLLPVARERTNCRGFATHVAWILGLDKMFIRNLGNEYWFGKFRNYIKKMYKHTLFSPLPKQKLAPARQVFQPRAGPNGWEPEVRSPGAVAELWGGHGFGL